MCIGEVGSAMNSRKPRGAATAPAMAPASCSARSRTSTKTASPPSTSASASSTEMLATSASASPINCMDGVTMVPLLPQPTPSGVPAQSTFAATASISTSHSGSASAGTMIPVDAGRMPPSAFFRAAA